MGTFLLYTGIFLVVFFGSIILYLIAMLIFIKKKVELKATVEIKAPLNKVMEKISNLENWKEWHLMALLHGAELKTSEDKISYSIDYSEAETTVTKRDKDNASIEFKTVYTKPSKYSVENNIELIKVSKNSTIVKWNQKRTPIKGIMVFFAQYVINHISVELELNLDNIKFIFQPEEKDYSFSMDTAEELSQFDYMAMNFNCNSQKIGEEMERVFSSLGGHMSDGMKDTKGGFSAYISSTKHSFKGFSGFIYSGDIPENTEKNIFKGTYPKVEYKKLRLIGSYDHLRQAWPVIYSTLIGKPFMSKEAPPLEIYRNDIHSVEPEKLITDLYVPTKIVS